MRSDSYVVILKTGMNHSISPETLKLVLTSTRHFTSNNLSIEVLAGQEWDELTDQEELLAEEQEVMF